MAKIATPSQKNGSKTSSATQEALQAEIAAVAYQLYAERGYQDGFDQEDWIRAESIVKNKKK